MDTPAPVTHPSPARRTGAGGLLLTCLLLLGAAVAAWFGWQRWQAQQTRTNAQAQLQRQALDARVEVLRATQRTQAQRLQQAEATNRVLRDELLGIGQRAALLEDSVSKLADPDRHGARSLRLDEIELLLGIGQQRLQLADDVDGARRALALAAPLLAGIDDPAYLSLRQTLAQELAALEALGVDPRVRVATLLDQLDASLRGVPVVSMRASNVAPWYERLLSRVVRVQPTASAGLGERADREAALVAAQIEVSLARAAIERRDQAGLAQALGRIDGWLQRLLAGSTQRGPLRRLVSDMRALPLRAGSPLAGTTLQQLRALRGG